MMNEKLMQLETKRLVQEFKQKHEKGEFRNKLGRVWWPVWNRIIVPTVALGTILTGTAPAIIAGVALWSVAHPFTKGFAINVQNIAIKNAGIFGKSMKNRNIPEPIRRQAVLEYLNQSGSLFFNRAYVKKYPDDINRLANGYVGNGINNLVALTEYNLTRQGNHNEKLGRQMTFGERVQIYKQSYSAYTARKKEETALLTAMKNKSR